MATPLSKNVSLANFLATVVSDGTYNDIVNVTKVDSGSPTPASQINEYGGELWANLIDQLFVTTYQQAIYKAAKWWACADATDRTSLGSGDALEVNDLAFQLSDATLWYCDAVTGGSSSTWTVIGSVSADVVGPASSTDNAVARFDSTSGKLLQNSLVIISDTGAISGVTDITLSGLVDGRDVAADGTTLDTHVADMTNPHSTTLGRALIAGNTTGGNDIELTAGDSIIMNEVAASPYAPSAGESIIWVKNDAPTTLWFTDDTGADYQLSGAGSPGDVNGPGSSTDNAIARFDGATGKLLQNSVVLVSDTGALSNVTFVNGVVVETHASRHENGGADEIDVTGLSGVLADPQPAIPASGADTTAIHDNVAGEIAAITTKAIPTTSDFLLIEDAADSDNKKKVTIGSLPFSSSVINTSRVTGDNGLGSTNTLILRWDTEDDSEGSVITYTDSATDGGYWQVSERGVYSVSLSVAPDSTQYVAINTDSALSNTFDATHIRAVVRSTSGTNNVVTLSWTGLLGIGDYIWCSVSAGALDVSSTYNTCTVTKVS